MPYLPDMMGLQFLLFHCIFLQKADNSLRQGKKIEGGTAKIRRRLTFFFANTIMKKYQGSFFDALSV